MSKALLYAEAIRADGKLHQELLAGVEEIALAVASTLGPRGRNVIIDRAGEAPKTTKDGVTVARNIQLSDPVRNAAAKMIQEVAKGTVLEAGDGTTTATVLAHSLLRLGLEHVGHGANPIGLQRDIVEFAAMLSQNIRAMAKQASPEIAAQVATIATNGNSQFGALVAQALEKVGPEGTITLDSSTNQTTYLEIRDGFQMNAGFLSPEFVTDREHGVAVLENPWILITERQLSQGTSKPPRLHDLGPLMNFCCGADAEGRTQVRDKRPLLILADDVLAGSDAMQLLLINHRQGNLQTCIVRAPGYGEFKRAGLSDLALATGGRVLGTDGGEALSRWVTDAKGNPSGARLGQCRRAVITRDRLVLEGCMGDPNDPEIATRYAASLREQAADATEPQTREYLLQRAARLTGSVAVLRVGAPTEEEAATLRDWAEDAVLAVRCAVREGVVAGGGMTLFALAQQLRSSAPDMQEHYKRAALILADAMEAPLRQIATNAGVDAQKVVDELLLQNAGKDETGDIIGYDAAAEVFRPMLAAGIVDPAKVVRVALEKAVSIAALMLTSSCMIYVDPKANAGQPIIHLPALPPQNMQGV